jgi:Uma2 family endonuclease
MSLLILDPAEAQSWLDAQSEETLRLTECWEGVTVVSPIPNDDHQELVGLISSGFVYALHLAGIGKVRPGVNVSDRSEDWLYNYRCPDVVVYLPENPAINHGSFWEGGPDFLVEIMSPGEDPEAKLEFYDSVGVREVLVVDRYPWALELFRPKRGKLASVGRSELPESKVLKSRVLPFTFQLKPGKPRPTVEMIHTPTGQVWKA